MSTTITIPVVIIGNGPSGLSLSHILSGYWPYYNGDTHPNDLLQSRLSRSGHESILKQNLEELSDGLNGRSSNPVAVLFDQLHHPNADLGLDMESCLSWRFDNSNTIQHLVLGRYSAGGSWRSIHKDGRTLGYSNWLELPGYKMHDWLNRRVPSKETGSLDRLDLGLVGHYYADYAKHMQIDKYIQSGVTVRSVRRYNLACNFFDDDTINMSSDLEESCCYETNVVNNDSCKRRQPLNSTGSNLDSDGEEFDECSQVEESQKKFNWIVDVNDMNADGVSTNYKILANQLVLATGVYDVPKNLNIPGEDLPFVYHRCPDFKRINFSPTTTGPILVVGSGLSAGDTILAALENGFNVAHSFIRKTNDHNLIFNRLPLSFYPEYRKVYELMTCTSRDGDDCYIPFCCYKLIEIKSDGTCVLESMKNSERIAIFASSVIILIGSSPNLSFLTDSALPDALRNETFTDYQSNPIKVDPYTYEVIDQPDMYAMGPLVGDNFVRFVTGGALAIASSIVKKTNLF